MKKYKSFHFRHCLTQLIKPFLLLLTFTISFIYANGQQNNLSISIDETGSDQQHTACKSIWLNPGYIYGAQPDHTMNCTIDPYMICDVDYSSISYSGANPGTFSTDYPVGTTAGSFGVSPTGAATYSIPIIVPTGMLGMSPNLALIYNSQSGNGIMGVGWAVAGSLSSISRTPQNIYYNGYTSPIKLTNDDWFTLDGNRLITNSGANGADGSIYHTEAESYARIKSFGQITSGTGSESCPSYFTVETKEGLMMEYGNTQDSKIEAKDKSIVLTWLLNKITDRNGNYIKFTYYEDNNTGEFRLDFIYYTGNDIAAITPFNKIKFVYEKRSDIQLKYQIGYPIKQSVVLSAIEMIVEGLLSKKYEFAYNFDQITGSHLSEIIEKGSDGKQYNSTKVGWNVSADPIATDPSNNSGERFLGYVPVTIDNYHRRYVGDFNGDGFTDYFLINVSTSLSNPTATWELYLNNLGLGYNNVIPITGNMPSGYAWQNSIVGQEVKQQQEVVYDLNGDGMEDVLIPMVNNNTDTYVGMLSTGNNFVLEYYSPGNGPSNDPDNGHRMLLGDFDGDGATDLFVYYYNRDLWHIYSWKKNTGYGCSGSCDWGNEEITFFIVDVNADGKDEIMFTFNNPWQPAGSGLWDYNFILGLDQNGHLATVSHGGFPNSSEGKNGNIFTGDFNGDGATDFLAFNYSTPHWLIGYATRSATGFPLQYKEFPAPFSSTDDPSNDNHNYEYFVADANGDGRSDIIYFSHRPVTNGFERYVNIYYSIGDNKFQKETITIPDNIWTPGGSFIGDFNGDGHADIFFRESDNSSGSPIHGFYFKGGGSSGEPAAINDYEKVSSISNGLNATIFIDYNTLPELARIQNQDNFYYKGSGFGSFSNVINSQLPISVVNKVSVNNGNEGLATRKYGYEQAKLQLKGKGFLGFYKVTTSAVSANLKTVEEFSLNTDYYFQYPFKTTMYKYNDNSLLNVNTLNYQITPISTSDKDYKIELINKNNIDNLSGVTIATDYSSYDPFGNVLQEIYSINGNQQTTIINNIYTQQGSWIPSSLETSTIISSRSENNQSQVPFSVTLHFEYDAKGNLTDEYEFYGLPKCLHTEYIYNNSVGAINNKTVSAVGVNSIVTNLEYDNKFRYITKEYNSLNQSAEIQYDARLGVPISTKSIEGLITRHSYDGFGRKTKTITPDHIVSETKYEWVPSRSLPTNKLNEPVYPLYSVTNTIQGSPTVKIYYDLLGRELQTETDGLNGIKIYSQKLYDNRGNLLKQTGSYFETGGLTPLITKYYYRDNIFPNELFKVETTDGIPANTNVTTFNTDFNADLITGNTKVTTTMPDGNVTSKTNDAAGKLIKATDNGGVITYEYFSSGLAKKIIVQGVEAAHMEYDDYGNQTLLWDKDAGQLTYVYDAFGRITRQVDARTNAYDMEYNHPLGLLTKKTGIEGIYNYSYVMTGNGLNNVNQITGPNNVTNSFTYDALGRVTAYTENNIGQTFSTTTEYDSYGNVSKSTYPNGFGVANDYDNFGHLKKIISVGDGSLIWRADEMNSLAQISKYTLGNNIQTQVTYENFGFPKRFYAPGKQDLSLSFDFRNGNLMSRTDAIVGITETFNYNNLNSLTQSQVAGLSPLNIGYNTNGTISNKTGAGDYSSYLGNKPDAVQNVNNLASNGSVISFSQQSISYSPFNKFSTITEGSYSLNITYGPDQQRVKTELLINGTNAETKYFHPGFEKLIKGGHTYEIAYVQSPAGLCAIHVTTDGSDAKMYFVYTDHLGSILKLTEGTNTYEQSFDAWGNSRDPLTWTTLTNGGIGGGLPWLYRGYTGHEHLPEFALINMNGRCYDPILGMMLSPDNYVQDATSTKSYNRYGYVLNNPLSYIDPDGNNPLPLIIGAAIIGAGFNVWSNWENIQKNPWSAAGYIANGAIGGAVSVFNPVLGSAIVAGGNVITDVAYGNAPGINSVDDVVKYGADKVIDGIGVGGAGGLAKLEFGTVTTYKWIDNCSISGTTKFFKDADGMLNGYIPEATVTSYKSFFSKVSDKIKTLATKGGVQYSDDLVKAAQKIYQNKAGKIELHHIIPKYLGGAKNGKLVPLDGAYHQQITNAFRKAWPYGQGKPNAVQLQKIIDDVYGQFPLPPGY